MAIPIELSARIHNYNTGDEAMLEAAYHYIHAPGFDTYDLYALLSELPFLNDRVIDEVNSVYQRVVIANSLLPKAKEVYTDMAWALGFSELKEAEMINAIKVCHYCVMGAKTIASSLDLPERETLAAFARIGVQTAAHILLHGKTEEKSYVKSNLVYFAAIEVLALGTRTDSYQYCHVDPQNVDSNLFSSLDLIRPIVKIRKGEEKKFFAQIIFGGVLVENRIVTKGEIFYYLEEDDSQEDSGEA